MKKECYGFHPYYNFLFHNTRCIFHCILCTRYPGYVKCIPHNVYASHTSLSQINQSLSDMLVIVIKFKVVNLEL